MRLDNLLSLGLVVWLAGCSPRPPLSDMRFSGTVEMTEHSVGMPVPGRLAEVLVEEEQPVRQGQVIARLEHFVLAERDFERAAALVGSGGVSQQDYEHERQDMEDRMVISPVDGVVLIKVRETGEVGPGRGPDCGDRRAQGYVGQGIHPGRPGQPIGGRPARDHPCRRPGAGDPRAYQLYRLQGGVYAPEYPDPGGTGDPDLCRQGGAG